MILDTIFPVIWFTLAVLALWAGLARKQKWAQWVFLAGVGVTGLGWLIEIISESETGVAPGPLFILGLYFMLLGPSLMPGGFLGMLVKGCRWLRWKVRAKPAESSCVSPVTSSPAARSILRVGMRLASRVLVVFAAVWLAWSAYWQLYVGFPGVLNFYANLAKYEGIVAKAKTMKLASNGTIGTTIDGFPVYIQVHKTGGFSLTIVLRDWHHAGSYGYVYDDDEPVPTGDSYFPYNVSAVLPALTFRLNKHWWTAYNGLN